MSSLFQGADLLKMSETITDGLFSLLSFSITFIFWATLSVSAMERRNVNLAALMLVDVVLPSPDFLLMGCHLVDNQVNALHALVSLSFKLWGFLRAFNFTGLTFENALLKFVSVGKLLFLFLRYHVCFLSLLSCCIVIVLYPRSKLVCLFSPGCVLPPVSFRSLVRKSCPFQGLAGIFKAKATRSSFYRHVIFPFSFYQLWRLHVCVDCHQPGRPLLTSGSVWKHFN